MVKVLDSQSSGPGFKTSEWFEGWFRFHSFEVEEISSRYPWGSKDKK